MRSLVRGASEKLQGQRRQDGRGDGGVFGVHRHEQPTAAAEIAHESRSFFGQHGPLRSHQHDQRGVGGHLVAQALREPKLAHLEVLALQELAQQAQGTGCLGVVGCAERALLVTLHEVDGLFAAGEAEDAFVDVLVENAQLGAGTFELGRDGKLLVLATARESHGPVAGDPQRPGLGRVHGLVGAHHGQLARRSRQVGEIPGQLLGHVVARRIEQGDLDGLVEGGHQLLGCGAGARRAEERQVGFDVALGGHVGDRETEHQGEGDAESRQRGRAHPSGIDPWRAGHARQREFHQEHRQRGDQQDGRPEHGERAVQFGHACVEGAMPEQGGQVAAREVQGQGDEAE